MWEAALDPRPLPDEFDDLLASVREAVLSGRKPPAQPRPVIANSWRRMQRLGVSAQAKPRRTASAETLEPATPLDIAALTNGRLPLPDQLSLMNFIPLLERELRPLLDDNVLLLVLSNAEGEIVWREGGRGLSRDADSLGFQVGDSWTERSVGTNAIGTSLIERMPVQVHAAEHFCQAQQLWSCTGAPVIDVRNGRPLGVIDLSTTASKSHPALVSLVASLASEVQMTIRQAHLCALDRLRSRTWIGASKITSPWIVVDTYGWVALSHGIVPPQRVSLPEPCDGTVMVQEIGLVSALPVPGGYLLQLVDEAEDISAQLQIRREPTGQGSLIVHRAESSWTYTLTPRQTRIAEHIAAHPEGQSAMQIALALYGSERSEVTVRAEISRLRRKIGSFLTARPYRFTYPVVESTIEEPHPAH